MGLWRVLQGMRAKSVRIFSIANVGRACEAAGVLNTQSIRNSTGVTFELSSTHSGRDRCLHHAPGTGCANADRGSYCEYCGPGCPHPIAHDAGGEQALQGGSSPAQGVFQTASCGGQCQRQMRPCNSPIQRGAAEVEVLAPVKSVDVDVTPLEKFLSHEYLGDLRWKIGDDGALFQGKDRLTPVGFVPALEKLIAIAKRK